MAATHRNRRAYEKNCFSLTYEQEHFYQGFTDIYVNSSSSIVVVIILLIMKIAFKSMPFEVTVEQMQSEK